MAETVVKFLAHLKTIYGRLHSSLEYQNAVSVIISFFNMSNIKKAACFLITLLIWSIVLFKLQIAQLYQILSVSLYSVWKDFRLFLLV